MKTQNFMCQMTWYGIETTITNHTTSETVHLCVFSFFLFVSQIFISSKNHPFAAILALHAFGALADNLLQ